MNAPAFLCVGGAHLDKKCRALVETRSLRSVPVHTESCLGGVARNTAENLARLGAKVALVSRVGLDKEGDWVLRSCGDLGIDTGYVSRSSSTSTASYTALMAPDGEVLVGISDMEIYNEIDATALTGLQKSPYPIWIVDANVPPHALEFLFHVVPSSTTLYANATSEAKAPRLNPYLDRIAVLFANLLEARALMDHILESPRELASALLDRGLSTVVIGCGREGLYFQTAGLCLSCPPPPVHASDVVGAGDALAAAFIYALSTGQSYDSAIQLGLRAAALTVISHESTTDDLRSLALGSRAEPWKSS